MKKKIVVTGSSGRIGSSIVKALTPDYEVVSIDRKASATTTIQGDIFDAELMEKALKDAYGLVHVAAYHAPHVGKVSDEEFQRVNVEGTKFIAELARRNNISRFIFTSTTALYGYASQTEGKASWIDESVEPKPKTIYHRTKLEAEKFLEGLAYEAGIRVSVIRMSRCFPEPANMMAVYRLHRGVDARDVADAHKLALGHEHIQQFDKFIISGKTPFKKNDCVDLLQDPEKILKIRCPELLRALGDLNLYLPKSIDRIYDSSKAQKELNWMPKYGYEEVLKQLKNSSSEIL